MKENLRDKITLSGRNKGIIQMAACSVLWSIAGIFIKLVPWNPFVIAGARSLIAAVTVIIYMKVTGQSFRMNRQVITIGIFEGMLFVSFVCANKLTTAANAIVLQFTAPIFLMLYSAVMYKTRFRGIDIAAAVFTMAGISLCFMDQLEGGHLAGNLVAIGAGALMGAMYLFTGSAGEENRMSGMLTGHIITAAVGLPFAFFTQNQVSRVSLLCILILGVFQLGTAYILYVQSTKTCPPLACSLISGIEPLLNPVWVALFGGEIPGILAVAGGIIVIAAVTAWCVLDAKQSKA